MITRYSRPEMRAIWTDENKLRIWLQIELLASEALVKEGVVPKSDFQKIKRGAEKCFADLKQLVERQKELEKILNHDVIGFTTAVSEKINDKASRWFHFGLTSSDIVDTAFAVQAAVAGGALTSHGSHRAMVERAYGYIRDNQILDDVPEPERYHRHASRGGWPFSNREHGWPITDCTSAGSMVGEPV